MDKILKFAKDCGYDSVKTTGIVWNGYTVYEPTYKRHEPAYTGYPYVILVKDDEMRMCTEDESLEILSIMYPNNEDEEG